MWSKTHVDGIVKDSDTLINQNFGLYKDQFDVMVINLKNGNEQLFEKIFLSHFQSCMKYLTTNYKIDSETAYDTTMDAMIEFRHKLILGKLSYGNLRYIFTKIASQLLIKENNREAKIKQVFFDYDSDNAAIEFQLNALEKAWVSLSDDEKMILEAYYYNELPLNQLALKMDKTDIAIRKQKQRAIEKLKQSFFNIFKY
jgi:RNA polymerase sigma factor (sigma-70 family)